jgi:hypothetical protein
MATKKDELIEQIKMLDPTSDVNEFMTLKEIKSIHTYLTNRGVTTEEPEHAEPSESDPPDGEPDAQPEPQTDEDFEALQARIAAASAPEPQKKTRRPGVEKTTRKKKKGQSDPDSFRIEGYILLLVTDTVFPFAFAALNNMLDKRIKISAVDLQLDEKQMAKLEPLADQAADYMAINLNPIAGFFLMSTFMYGNNLLTLRMSYEVSMKPENEKTKK